jgi:hypothetical protein
MSGLAYADRVQETTTTTGTGAVTLLGAVASYQSFNSAFATGQSVYYCITDNTSVWEVGKGTYTTSGTTLSRDRVFASSNAGALVNLGAGTYNVFCVLPAVAIVDKGLASAFAMGIVAQ